MTSLFEYLWHVMKLVKTSFLGLTLPDERHKIFNMRRERRKEDQESQSLVCSVAWYQLEDVQIHIKDAS